MDYQLQVQILKENFKQARETFYEESSRAGEDPAVKIGEVFLNLILQHYAYKANRIRLAYDSLTDIAKERREKHKRRKFRWLNRQFKQNFAICKERCGVDRYYQIKKPFFLERKRLHKQRIMAQKAFELASQQSKDEGSCQVAESHEHNIIHPVVLKSKL